MANPGYPQMGQMPPGMAPVGAVPRPRPVRRGTSKAVPVVVSAGLAVGVFCGLLFGVGTGKHDAQAAPSTGTNVKGDKPEDDTPAPSASTAPTKPAQKGSGAGSAVAMTGSGAGSAVAMTGSGAGSAAGAAAGSAVAVKTAKLTVQVKPDAAAPTAKVQIDGKDIDGMSIELPADKKSVKVSITASGYHTADKTVDILGDETTVQIELVKRSGGGASPGFGGASKPGSGGVPTRPPGGTGDSGGSKKPPPKKPGGLIDI